MSHKKLLRVWIDMSERISESAWLPAMRELIVETINRLERDDTVTLRLRGFSHFVAWDGIDLHLQRGTVIDDLMKMVEKVPRMTEDTNTRSIWNAIGQEYKEKDALIEYAMVDDVMITDQQPDILDAEIRDAISGRFRSATHNRFDFAPTMLFVDSIAESNTVRTKDEDHVVEADNVDLVVYREDLSTEDAKEQEYEKDPAELAAEVGFRGTLNGFLDWLEESLGYGGMRTKNVTDHFGRPVLRVELFTGGFSSNERLLGRVYRSVYTTTAWRSTHAGGLYVYEFNKEWQTSSEEIQWLQPELDEPFETIGRARKIRIVSASGKETQILEGYHTGVELIFSEEGPTPGSPRDINTPAGVLTIRPIPEERSYWK